MPEPEEDLDEPIDGLEFRPFPVKALPPIVRELVEQGTEAIGCDASMIAMPLLASLAAAVGNARRLRLKRGWDVPPVLWTAVLADSGSKKSAAYILAMRPLETIQKDAFAQHARALKQFRADHLRWKDDPNRDPNDEPQEPAPRRVKVDDCTLESLAPILSENPRGILLSRDELSGWLGGFDRYTRGKGDAGAWLSMFDASSIIVDRKGGQPKTIHVEQAAVAVTGAMTPATMTRLLGREHVENGLLARFLLTCPPRRPKTWSEAEVPEETVQDLTRLVQRLLEDLHPAQVHDADSGESRARPEIVNLSPQAKRLWVEHYQQHAAEQADLTGDLAAAWSKLEQIPARLALIVHCCRWAAYDSATEANPLTLDAESMQAGVTLTAWFKHETRRAYAMLSEDEQGRETRRFVEWIALRGGRVTVRQVRQGCRWLRGSDEAEAALQMLAKSGKGVWENTPPTSQGGRPSRVFVLHASTKPQKTT